MDALSIICLLVKLLVRWFHSVWQSLFDSDQRPFGNRFLPDTFLFAAGHIFCRIYIFLVSTTSRCELFCSHLSACLYRSKSSALPAELFLDDRHTLPPLCVDCSVHTFQIGFCLSNLLACLYRLKLLRSLFLWQSCFSMCRENLYLLLEIISSYVVIIISIINSYHSSL